MATQLIQPPFGSPSWFVQTVERSKVEPTMQIVDLTPVLAKFILDVNVNNRSVRNVKVAQYAADMVAGKWALNGEPLIISTDGNLNDGQHRCLAVVESNATIQTAMMFGIERETRLTVDQGALRTAGDFLGMEGVSNAPLVAAIARMVIAYERGSGASLLAAKYVTSTEIRLRVMADEALAEAATFGHTNANYSRKFAAASLIGFAFYVLNKVHMAEARLFLERVCRGDGLRIGDPAHTLREKLISEGRAGRDPKIAMLFKAWNFHRRGMKVRTSTLNSTLPFPALL